MKAVRLHSDIVSCLILARVVVAKVSGTSTHHVRFIVQALLCRIVRAGLRFAHTLWKPVGEMFVVGFRTQTLGRIQKAPNSGFKIPMSVMGPEAKVMRTL